ncbi:MAG: FecR domain-containing protein [Spirochaetia bacterium]|nr:FecR domain-containing protein [Spirochaetia bacterium]
MRLSRILLALAIVMAGSALALAQTTGQTVELEFVQGNDLTLTMADGTVYTYATGNFAEGDIIAPGAQLRTGPTTTAELRLKPNGTLIKIAKSTSFRVDGLATPQQNNNVFTLVAGKVRMAAAKGSNYQVLTSSTVAGVRGTDFTMSFEEGRKATLMVAKGAVEFGKLGAAAGETILVGAGQFADFFTSFTPKAYTPEQFAGEYGDVQIDPERIPASALENGDQAPADTASDDADTADTDDGAATDVADSTDSGGDTAGDGTPESPEAAVESAFVTWLRDVLGMEIGSVTINGQTWSKAVLQPTFTVGKFKTALYLPVIYSQNLFDPDDWYHPNGNDEWSFGTDIGWSSDPWNAFLDAAADVALKFKYIEYGQPVVDPFFIKVGNLSSFTVGHGLVMRDYANDTEFPAVRRLGFNIGLDLGSWGFEALANDLADPQVFGGRVYVRPIKDFKLAFGLSAVADFHPAAIFDTDTTSAEDYGDPIFIGTGLDLDLPIVDTDILGVRAFADAAVMLPIVRNDFTYLSSTGGEGVRVDMLWDGGLQNWGAAIGFMGNVAFIDWRLEYRYFTGAFRPAFFDAGYERARAERVLEWAGYLSGAVTVDQAPSVMGIYGEGGTSIFKDKLTLTFGYFWPWSADAATLTQQMAMANDYFKAELTVKKGLIPVLDLSGAIIYERRNFVPTLLNTAAGGVSLFDENTVFGGEIVVPVPGAPNLDLAVIVNTVIEREPDGSVIYRDAPTNTMPSIVPAITLETRLHF